MRPSASSTTAERLNLHRRKMVEKAGERATLYNARGAFIANHLTKRVRGKITTIFSVHPNNGKSNSIWPKGKVAKPGRMA